MSCAEHVLCLAYDEIVKINFTCKFEERHRLDGALLLNYV
jgi:hypothetical protein